MAPYNANTNPQGGAQWQYIGANVVVTATGNPLVPATWTKSFGQVKVGFVGAVTEELPSLVSPSGLTGLEVRPIVSSVNTYANQLKADGADLIILLVHEGAPSVALADATSNANAFGQIVNGVNPNIDAIISGHTHLAYNHSVPVPAWAGRPVTERPVVSSGQYGSALNQLLFTVNTSTGQVTAKTQNLLNLKTGQTANYPSDPATAQIVADAVAAAAPLGAVELGKISAPFSRAKFGDGVRENRGGESSLGNFVAEVQRWATRNPESGSAQIALMNPGGLRADITGSGTGAFPRAITYKQAADVQPFANTLVNMDLTGAQLETALEQQWQTAANGSVPTRPFLKLGTSDGFKYTYYTYTTPRTDDPTLTRTAGEVTSMTLNGSPVLPGQTYSVTVNSFLASGGDNFRELNNGAGKSDTGKADLQAMVDYFAAFSGTAAASPAVAPKFDQHAVGTSFTDNDTSVPAGESISFNLSSLIMTGAVGTAPNQVLDPKDDQVQITLVGGGLLGTFPVDQTIPNPGSAAGQADAASADEAGKASVTVTIPRSTSVGDHELRVIGLTTGTSVDVPIVVEQKNLVGTTVTGSADDVEFGQPATVTVTVVEDDNVGPLTGTVTLLDGTTEIGTATLTDGEGDIEVPASALEVGENTFTLEYSGDGDYAESTGTVTVTVVKATAELSGTAATFAYGDAGSVTVTVTGGNATGTVTLTNGADEIGTAELTNGTGTIAIPALELTPGDYTLGLAYEGDGNYEADTATVAVTVTKGAATVAATATPAKPVVFKDGSKFVVTVSASGYTPTGTVTLKSGGKTIGSGTLAGGTVTINTLTWKKAGSAKVTVQYSGDANTNGASTSKSVSVAKQKPSLAVKAPAKVKKGTAPKVVATLTGVGAKVGGVVRFTFQGKTVKRSLVNGKATLTIGKVTKTTKVKVTYLGNANWASVSKTVTIRLK